MKIDTENPSYQRDLNSKALLQTNRKELDEYKMKRMMVHGLKEKEHEINNLRTEIDELKSDIKQIKDLIIGLVNK